MGLGARDGFSQCVRSRLREEAQREGDAGLVMANMCVCVCVLLLLTAATRLPPARRRRLQDVGGMYAALVRDAKRLRVVDVGDKEDRKSRPHGLNTVELLKVGGPPGPWGGGLAQRMDAAVGRVDNCTWG